MKLYELAAGVVAQVPTPTGPDAPQEVKDLVTKWLNLGWYCVLVSAFATALWGCGSLAYSSKNQQFGGVNAGKKLIFWSFAGASGVSLIRVLFMWFGV